MTRGEGAIFGRDTAPMRIEFRVAQFPRDALFKLLGYEMFQAFRFVVQFFKRVIEYFEQEGFDKPVMAYDLKRTLSPFLGEPHAPMGLIFDERMVCRSQLLEHIRN